jgi:UDP-N-acetylglucosamine--N-acetylmuramyl-(pentapeptide) pyrophosphoryl-undecaprenol N-acetylglucosamine transferase
LLKIIISGGGTGGHIFPALAIANAIKELRPDTDFLFVGANGRMEMEKVPAAGFNIKGLDIAGINRSSILKNISFPYKLWKSLNDAKQIVKLFKPDIAIGVGGYASGPLLWAAQKQKIPTVIQEQNSYPGITNKLLSKKVKQIFVAYSGLEKYFPKEKIKLTGNPVRADILNLEGKREKGIVCFNLDKNKKTVFVTGGSLGARKINQSIKNCLQLFRENNVQLIWQTGKLFFSEATQAAKEIGYDGVQVFEFVKEMDLAYAVADVVVSRAGAGAISELCIVGKASILVPLPTAAEDHQTHNAMSLVDKNAALLVRDSAAIEQLPKSIFELLNNSQKQNEIETNAKQLGLPNSAKIIADDIIKLIVKN